MIPFTKAHACGNDFLIVSEEAAEGLDRAEMTRRLCARNTGVGADGIEFFAWTGARSGRIRLYNADGSMAEISGNGTRCVAAYMAQSAGLEQGETLEITTDAGLRNCYIDGVNATGRFVVGVTTGMGEPQFAARTVTVAGGLQIAGTEISTGNPHFVIVVDNPAFDVDGQSWQSIGQQMGMHPDFPYGTNVEFVRLVDEHNIKIRIFERGVGATSSSGTGTSAAATAAIALHGCLSPLTVTAPGGKQTVRWAGTGHELFLTGPAELIAAGEAWYG